MPTRAEKIERDFDEFMERAMAEPGVRAVMEVQDAAERAQGYTSPPAYALTAATSTNVFDRSQR